MFCSLLHSAQRDKIPTTDLLDDPVWIAKRVRFRMPRHEGISFFRRASAFQRGSTGASFGHVHASDPFNAPHC